MTLNVLPCLSTPWAQPPLRCDCGYLPGTQVLNHPENTKPTHPSQTKHQTNPPLPNQTPNAAHAINLTPRHHHQEANSQLKLNPTIPSPNSSSPRLIDTRRPMMPPCPTSS